MTWVEMPRPLLSLSIIVAQYTIGMARQMWQTTSGITLSQCLMAWRSGYTLMVSWMRVPTQRPKLSVQDSHASDSSELAQKRVRLMQRPDRIGRLTASWTSISCSTDHSLKQKFNTSRLVPKIRSQTLLLLIRMAN